MMGALMGAIMGAVLAANGGHHGPWERLLYGCAGCPEWAMRAINGAGAAWAVAWGIWAQLNSDAHGIPNNGGIIAAIGGIIIALAPYVFKELAERRAERAATLARDLEAARAELARLGAQVPRNTATAAATAGATEAVVSDLQRAGFFASGPAHDAAPASRLPARLLIVEDDPDLITSIAAYFTRHGFMPMAASTVKDALEYLDVKPDWIMLDLRLIDGADGLEILRAAKDRGMADRVVVTTGTPDPARLAAARELGPAAVLSKPVDQAALLGIMRRN